MSKNPEKVLGDLKDGSISRRSAFKSLLALGVTATVASEMIVKSASAHPVSLPNEYDLQNLILSQARGDVEPSNTSAQVAFLRDLLGDAEKARKFAHNPSAYCREQGIVLDPKVVTTANAYTLCILSSIPVQNAKRPSVTKESSFPKWLPKRESESKDPDLDILDVEEDPAWHVFDMLNWDAREMPYWDPTGATKWEPSIVSDWDTKSLDELHLLRNRILGVEFHTKSAQALMPVVAALNAAAALVRAAASLVAASAALVVATAAVSDDDDDDKIISH